MIQAVMGVVALALVVIAVRWPRHLVPAAIICSVFEGAAIVNAGGLGISPYSFTLLLILAHCAFIRVTAADAMGHSPGVRRVLLCAAALAVVCLCGAVVLPRVFAGWQVMSPRLNADALSPLQFSTSNIGQSVYLVLNLAFLWYAAQRCRTPAAAEAASRAFLIAGTIVVVLGLYQLVSAVTGLPFPDTVLYSNDAYVMQSGTAILEMPRICSTFTEPSSLGVFLVSFVAYLMTRLETPRPRNWLTLVLLIAAVAVLILSTSSTAYVGLAALAAWAVGRHVLLPMLNGRGSLRAAILIGLVLMAAVCTFLASSTLQDVIQQTVFEKDQSSSYEERSQADHTSMQLAENTWGLGVGLGSNRASSFLPSMLSTIGVCGACTLGLLVALLVLPGEGEADPQLQRPLAAALLAVVGAKMISSPDLATPSMWALMGALVAVRAAAPVPAAATVAPAEPAVFRRRERTLSFD